MTVEEFIASAERGESPPDELPATLKALWYAQQGKWERAHGIADRVRRLKILFASGLRPQFDDQLHQSAHDLLLLTRLGFRRIDKQAEREGQLAECANGALKHVQGCLIA